MFTIGPLNATSYSPLVQVDALAAGAEPATRFATRWLLRGSLFGRGSLGGSASLLKESLHLHICGNATPASEQM
jgi:hypothetical protein